MELPAGSTPLDFAFKIHSAVGYKCVGAKVNGKIVPLDTTLKNGNIVEIITSNNSSGPSTDWLKIAKSSSARNKIRQWIKKENQSDSVEKGKEILEKYVRKKGYDSKEVMKNSYIAKAYKQLSLTSADEMYTQLAAGGAFIGRVAAVLFGYYNDDKHIEEQKNMTLDTAAAAINEKSKKAQHKKKDMSGIVVKGVDNLMIRVSKCCNPVPGDEIIGFITKGRGISVHRTDCANVISMPEEERSRFIEVEWDQTKLDKSYSADISIIADDRKGLLSDISRVCDDMDVNITGVNARSDKDRVVTITMTLSISNTAQMQKILRSLRSVQGVTDVYRSAV